MHGRKYVAPAVIAALLLAYYIGVAVVFSILPNLPLLLRALLIVVPLALCGVVIYVLCQRIREIHDGEEDDLDKF